MLGFTSTELKLKYQQDNVPFWRVYGKLAFWLLAESRGHPHFLAHGCFHPQSQQYCTHLTLLS